MKSGAQRTLIDSDEESFWQEKTAATASSEQASEVSPPPLPARLEAAVEAFDAEEKDESLLRELASWCMEGASLEFRSALTRGMGALKHGTDPEATALDTETVAGWDGDLTDHWTWRPAGATRERRDEEEPPRPAGRWLLRLTGRLGRRG